MKEPNTLTPAHLRRIVADVQWLLWYEVDDGRWNLDKEWTADTIDAIARVLVDAGLAPTEE